ncbi:hypothetical protein P9112_014014 [Eukaryota sp. TZLM1-RC]
MTSLTSSPLVNNCISQEESVDNNEKILVNRFQLEKAAELVRALEEENRHLKQRLEDEPQKVTSSIDNNHFRKEIVALEVQLKEETQQLRNKLKEQQAIITTSHTTIQASRVREQRLQKQLDDIVAERNRLTTQYEEQLFNESKKLNSAHDKIKQLEAHNQECAVAKQYSNEFTITRIQNEFYGRQPTIKIHLSKLYYLVVSLFTFVSLIIIWI